jgi:glycosyltransferase involved in cell wall biosynthesis
MSRRILVVTSSYPSAPGDPSGHFIEAEVRRLVAAGDRVVVVAPGGPTRTPGNPEVHRIADGGCFGWPGALSRLRSDPRRALGAARFVVGAIVRARALGPFDRTVAHFMVPCGFPIASALPGPLELVGHGSDVRLLAALPGARSILRGWLDRGATLRLSAERLRKHLARATRLDLSAVLVAPSPIDIGAPRDRVGARRALGIDTERSVATVVGRLVPSKRVDAAIAHGARLGREVFVIGEGPEHRRLAARFPEAHFLGLLPRDTTLSWIAASDVLIHASHHEGAPTVIREARALGVPVITAVGGDAALWAERDPGITVVDL